MASVCNRLGWFVHVVREFSSRIKGGSTSGTVRIANQRILASRRGVDILVALDQEAIDRSRNELRTHTYVIADKEFSPRLPADAAGTLVSLPLTRLARECHSPLLRNIVALGASATLMGLEVQPFREAVIVQFGRKGRSIADANVRALDVGAAAAQAAFAGSPARRFVAPARAPHVVISGNAAMALGAIAAGCRVMATYPITPAYEIQDELVPLMAEFGGLVVQMEDELSALAVCIGAGFAGARALTATSGPGLSLMQENLGLAIMLEVPLVLVDVQRAGPSSGMATRHEQSDVMAMLFGTHGDAPRIVLSPGEPGEAYADMITAFNLADRYHTPVVVASDLSLGLSRQSVPESALESDVIIDRGPIVSGEALEDVRAGSFARYSFAGGGVSPRTLPGERNGQYLASGVEHNPHGNGMEDPTNRVAMVGKRSAKLRSAATQCVASDGPPDPDILLLAFGSTGFVVLEAAAMLRERGIRCEVARIRVLSPFPIVDIERLAAEARLIVVVENNSTGQLANLVRVHGFTKPLRSILKYDGRPFDPKEIVAGAIAWQRRRGSSVGEPLVVGESFKEPTPIGDTWR
jgi:2-oxoglutarate ferredoxin oxidoreductase subunit alpha